MRGGVHFVIGAATAGIGLWGLSAAGVEISVPVMFAGAATAGAGCIGTGQRPLAIHHKPEPSQRTAWQRAGPFS